MSHGSLPVPKSVRAPHGAQVLQIDWADGVSQRYHHWVLRGFCPCAVCQGHDGPLVFVAGTEQAERSTLELRDLRRVGNYALGLTWGDGHGSGIYTYAYLRLLGELFDRSPEEIRRFQPPR